jgi:hypothetical protein
MSTLTVKELAAPTGFDLTLASGETLDLSSGTVTLPTGVAALTLISTTNVTDGDSYVTLSDVFSSTYDKYILEGINFLPNTDNTAIRGNFQSGGSYNTSSVYDTVVGSISNGSLASWINLNNAAYAAFSGHGNQGNGANEQVNFCIEIMQPSSTSSQKFWRSRDIGYAADGNIAAIFSGGSWTNNAAITGVRFYYSSGTFKTGKLKLYGVK